MQIKDMATLLNVTDQTIYNWVEKLPEFLSTDAKGEGGRREFDLNDQSVLITIWAERNRNASFEDIRAMLAAGHRTQEIPPGVANVSGVTPLALYTQSMAVVTERNMLQLQLAEKEAEIDRLRQQVEAMHEKWREDKAQSATDLNREIGRLQAKIEMMLEQQKSQDRDGD